MKILFAFNSYGLGHATRSLPLALEAIRQNHKVYIMAFGRSLEFLKRELGSKVASYFELRDYSFNKVFGKKKFSSKKFMLYQPLFMKEVKAEHQALRKLHAIHKFDIIYSDARTGIYLPDVPSFILTNQLKVGSLDIWRLAGELFTERYMNKVGKYYRKIIVPDTEFNSISGEITHNLRFIPRERLEYIGILSMLTKTNVPEDIDYFFSISGPEPQRTVFEKKVLEQIDKLQGKKVVVTLGCPEKADYQETRGTLQFYGLLDKTKQADIMNRSKLVITRSGYSTVMDLAELEKKALYLPTKGQPEQEYLARYHWEQGNNYFVKLEKLNIPADLEQANKFPGYKPEHKTKESVRRFLEVITT